MTRNPSDQRSPRILVVNLHSYKNPGDAALSITTAKHLRRNYPNCDLTLVMHDVGSYQGSEVVLQSFNSHFKSFRQERGNQWQMGTLLWVPISALLSALVFRIFHRKITFLLNQSIRELLSAYLAADLILSAPGNYLYSSGFVGLPFLISLFSIVLGIIMGKPVYLLPQSIGPLRRAYERTLLKWTLSRCRLVMLREPITYKLIETLQLPQDQLHLLHDLAFDYSDTAPEEAERWLSSYGISLGDAKPLLGITTTDLPQKRKNPILQSQYEHALAKLISGFIEGLNGHVVLFTHVSGSPYVANDHHSATRIASLIPEHSSSITLIGETRTASIHRSAYGFMDVFVGTRMHSNIFAMIEAVPTLAIAYFPKTIGIMEMLGLERWTIDAREINPEDLFRWLEELWKDREEKKKNLENKVSEAAKDASLAFQFIAEDYALMQAQT